MLFQSIREKINQNQKPFVIGGIVLVCVAVGLLAWELKPASVVAAPTSYYFYDTSNGSITTEPASAIPPLKGATGQDTLVRAFMLTCTTCGDKKVAYLIKYNQEARAAITAESQALPANATPMEKSQHAAEIPQLRLAAAAGRLVRLPAKGSPWIPAMSFKGMALIKAASQCPGGSHAKPCLP